MSTPLLKILREAIEIHNKKESFLKESVCAICKEEVKFEDFNDGLSRKEYAISAMCQKCQDKVFG